MNWTISLTALPAVGLLAYFTFAGRTSVDPREPPCIPFGIPFIGHAIGFMRKKFEYPVEICGPDWQPLEVFSLFSKSGQALLLETICLRKGTPCRRLPDRGLIRCGARGGFFVPDKSFDIIGSSSGNDSPRLRSLQDLSVCSDIIMFFLAKYFSKTPLLSSNIHPSTQVIPRSLLKVTPSLTRLLKEVDDRVKGLSSKDAG